MQRVEAQICEREQLIEEQKERQRQLLDEIENHKDREQRRLADIQQMMAENEKVYHDLTLIRHKLYEVSIEQEIDI